MDAKSRSYEVRRVVHPGSAVEITEPVHFAGALEPGSWGTLLSYSNAGFRGIEARVRLAEPAARAGDVVTVSAGILVEVDEPDLSEGEEL